MNIMAFVIIKEQLIDKVNMSTVIAKKFADKIFAVIIFAVRKCACSFLRRAIFQPQKFSALRYAQE
jgi:hypothetical protein